MGQPKCVCSVKCHAPKHPRRHKQNKRIDELIMHTSHPVVEMIPARPSSERQTKNERIVSIRDSDGAIIQDDCNSFRTSSVNCTKSDADQRPAKQQQYLQRHRKTAEWNGKAGNEKRHRNNATLEDRIRTRFFGYDMPYPPIDFPVI